MHHSFSFQIGFTKRKKNVGPLNDHIITELSWVVTMAQAVPSTDIN